MITLEKGLRFYNEVLQHVRMQDTLRRIPFKERVFVLTPQLADDYGLEPGDQLAGYTLITESDFTRDHYNDSEA